MGETKKEILGRFMRLQGLLHRYQAQNFMNFGPWGNPQRGQGRVLALLKLKPEISQKELTYLLDMSKQGLAELLNKLEKNEFITRETSEEDRRSVNIKLTEKGAAVAGEMGDMPPELEKLFDVLNDEELANLSDYLKRITERLEEQFTDGDGDLRKQMMERLRQCHHHHGRNFGGHRGDFHGFYGGVFPHRRGGRRDDDGEREE